MIGFWTKIKRISPNNWLTPTRLHAIFRNLSIKFQEIQPKLIANEKFTKDLEDGNKKRKRSAEDVAFLLGIFFAVGGAATFFVGCFAIHAFGTGLAVMALGAIVAIIGYFLLKSAMGIK